MGGVVTGVVSLLMLALQNRTGVRRFEAVIMGFLLVIVVGFVSSNFLSPPRPGEALAGLVPRFDGAETVLLAASMLGATVMPPRRLPALGDGPRPPRHRRRPRHPPGPRRDADRRRRGARRRGLVNISMLLLAASALRGVEGTDTLEGAHAAVAAHLGTGAALLFAIGLLASGLASTSVGAYAGAVIMQGLLRIEVPCCCAAPSPSSPPSCAWGSGWTRPARSSCPRSS